MTKGNRLNSREERTHNLVSIQPYDNTSHAYRKEPPSGKDTPFGFYLSISIITFVVIFLIWIYELAIEGWKILQ